MFQKVKPPFVPEQWKKHVFFYSANHVFMVGGPYVKIVTKKFFQKQCHLAKKKYRDRFFYDEEHQRLWWKYKHFFHAGEKRVSLRTQHFVTKSITDRWKHFTEPNFDRTRCGDYCALPKLSPLMQHILIRKMVNTDYTTVTKTIIYYNSTIYQQHDRRVQLQYFFSNDFYIPKPLVKLFLSYLGYKGD